MDRYDRCPKCDHAPLPEDQALPAACSACGIILAKFRALREDEDEAGEAPPHIDEVADRSTLKQRLLARILYVPEKADPLAYWSRSVLLVLLALWGLRLIALDHETGEMMNSFLHGPLLIFHEAGHVVFWIFGEFLMMFGGSFAQVLLPAILAGALLRNHDTFGAAIGTWLIGVSLLDLAPYIYDAFDPKLTLLGGHTGAEGGHDWIYLLNATSLLNQAHSLGWLTHKLGALTIIASLAWGGWVLLQQKRRGFVRSYA